jgi:NAD(P)-dependent dehydrogenase (short-subunit alcohol dehydrogenase family)
VEFSQTDVSDAVQTKVLAEYTIDVSGGLDILMNNAAVVAPTVVQTLIFDTIPKETVDYFWEFNSASTECRRGAIGRLEPLGRCPA